MRVISICLVLFLSLVPVAMGGTLTAIHGIPGDSVDESLERALPVDVYVNDGLAFSFSFGDTVADVDLPAGEYTVKVCLEGTDTCVLEESATISEEGNYTAVAHLTYTGDAPGIALTFFENDLNDISENDSRLILRHTANAPSVKPDIWRYFDSVRVPGFSNQAVEVESAEGSTELMPNPEELVLDFRGGYTYVGLLAGGDTVFSTGPFKQERGKVYAGYAIGDFFKGSFDVILQVVK